MRWLTTVLPLLGALTSLTTARVVPLPPLNPDTGLPVSPPATNPPELEELTAETFFPKLSKGTWFVKHYSPRCSHCRAMAPHFMALHDIYTTAAISGGAGTASPKAEEGSQAATASFTETYGFRFAEINCDAYGDVCSKEELGVIGYPTLNLFRDGKLLGAFPVSGRRDLESMSAWVEEWLEKIKPSGKADKGDGKKEKTKEAGADKKEKEKEKGKGKEGEKGAEKDVVLGKDAEPSATGTAVDTKTVVPTSSAIPNEEGRSVFLTRDTFLDKVEATGDPWLVKFYAPWCSHCQALFPTWIELAREMQGSLNIGEVNCDEESWLCKKVRLRGYPTLIFFRGGQRIEYDGLRGLGDLVSWAKKAADAGIQEMDILSLDKVLETEEVFFIYVYNEATTSEDFAALERTALPLIGHAKMYKTSSKAIAERFRVGDFPVSTYPRLLVVRDGTPAYYTAFSPADMRDTQKLLSWMRSVWLPLLPELTASNAHEIMNGKLVVLAILSRERTDGFREAKREMKEAATLWLEARAKAEKAEKEELREKKQMRIEEAEDRGDQNAVNDAKNIHVEVSRGREVGFAWVDGVFWERWVRGTYGVDVDRDGERVVINDEDAKWVWETTIGGHLIPLRRTEIVESVKAVVDGDGRVKGRRTSKGLQRWVMGVRGGMGQHPVLVWGGLLASLMLAGMWGRGRIRRGRMSAMGNGGAHHHHHHSGSVGGEKGWLGSGPQAGGKFD